MKTDHRSQSEVPHHKDVPFEARQSVIEQRSLSEHADVMRFGEQARKANLIVQEHKEQLTNLMGSSKYEQFRAYVAEQKRYQAELFFPPRGPQMTRSCPRRWCSSVEQSRPHARPPIAP